MGRRDPGQQRGVYPESTDAKVVDTPTAMWRETFETNLFGAVRMCREVVRS
jgi:NAD(P)-dependent dehydrogenase (short-subunit alcohol dehydrogenase family)